MYIIRTAYKNVNGTPKVVARCDGKQRTVNFDAAKSSAANHGTAAGTLALALDLPWHDGIEHDMSEDGNRHAFAWTPPVLIDLARASIK